MRDLFLSIAVVVLLLGVAAPPANALPPGYVHAAAALPSDASTPQQTAAVVRAIRAVLADEKIDLAKAQFAYEKLVDPAIDMQAMLGEVDRITRVVRGLAGPDASNATKLAALKLYLYRSGTWNSYAPFHYDFTDPYGRDYTHALVSRYLTRSEGNCVSMPILFVILGDRLGLPMTLAMAPRHIFVKYKDDATGRMVNLETTSGANPARDVWLRHENPMSDRAVASGIYMKPLARKEMLAVMAGVVLESDRADNRYRETVAVADLLLRAYPKFVQAMIFRGVAYEGLIETEFRAKFPTFDRIPSALVPRYAVLADNADASFAEARSLGWRSSDGHASATDAASPMGAPSIADAVALHTYVRNDPANNTDPSGRDPLQDSIEQEQADRQILDQCGGNGQCIRQQEQLFAQRQARIVAVQAAGVALMAAPALGAVAVETFIARVGLSGEFLTAAGGGRNAGFLSNVAKSTLTQIQRGVRSLDAKIAEHEAKLADPASHVENPWSEMRPSEQESIVRDWKSEIQLYKEQRAILKDLEKLKQLEKCTGSRIPGGCY